jgi:hypothetical protein
LRRRGGESPASDFLEEMIAIVDLHHCTPSYLSRLGDLVAVSRLFAADGSIASWPQLLV